MTQTLTVRTPGCEGARCELSNDKGTWIVARTPGTVTLTSSAVELRVTCSAGEGVHGHGTAVSSAPAVTGEGAAAGGLAGAGIGAVAAAPAAVMLPPVAVVIVLAGAAAGAGAGHAAESHLREIRYPNEVVVPMNCGPAHVPPVEGGEFGFAIRSATRAEAEAANLGDRGVVLVTSVASGSRAAAAGLRPGDLVLAAGGHAAPDAAALEEAVRALAPGASIVLQVRRQSQTLDIVLTRAKVAP